MRFLKHVFKLVEKNKDARLCCKSGLDGLSEIKKMPWFDGMDWGKLEEKKLTPPMRPDVSLFTVTTFSPLLISFTGQGKF